MTTRAVKGTKDIFGTEAVTMRRVEGAIHDICRRFGFGEIRTPIFEETELFVRSAGESTDIVSKQMYSWDTKSGKSLTLKPEGTAPVVRAYVEHALYSNPQPTKLYYITPCFRYEQPQSGRQRQFHQFGAEVFGAKGPAADAEIIALAHGLLDTLGVIGNTRLYINSLGTPEARKNYTSGLTAYLQSHKDALCTTCKARLSQNPLRVLDCKDEGCIAIAADAPSILDHLDPESREHFDRLQRLLRSMGIEYAVDSRIVRGLDYYNRTVFEFVGTTLGAQSTVCGGGRYDGLVEYMGGPPTSAVGFGIGLERLILAMDATDTHVQAPDIFLGYIGEEGFVTAQVMAHTLRKSGVSAEADALERSIKAQLKYANKIGARFCAIIGDEEVKSQVLRLRNMAEGTEAELGFDDVAGHILCHIAIPV